MRSAWRPGWLRPPRGLASPPTDYTPGRRSFRRAQGVRILNFQLSILAGPCEAKAEPQCKERERGGKEKATREGETLPGGARRAEERAHRSKPEAREASEEALRLEPGSWGLRAAARGSRRPGAARLARALLAGRRPGFAIPWRGAPHARVAMSYPQGYFVPAVRLAGALLCPAYSTSVISGPARMSSAAVVGLPRSPYAGSTAFTAPSPGYNSHLQYGADPIEARRRRLRTW